eukprot:Tamp_19648.p1 GENE.Tamp_19648~~Tamp_19648.p1  ORF type:complete len:363 (+),score=88.52 Tamp_19648:68-1090(+)
MERVKEWFNHGSLSRVQKAAEHDARGESAGQALVDKVPTVAGALKTIEEVKKMARHASPQAEHRKNFFDSLTGWGNKKRLEDGWKLTHGAESVHESAAVHAAEAASKAAARGDKDSGDGFFDDWGHVSASASPPSSSSSHAPASGTSSAASPAAHTEGESSPAPVPGTSKRAPGARVHAPTPSSAEGGASESSLEPPPLPSFLKHKDPLRGIHVHASSSPPEKHARAAGSGKATNSDGQDGSGAHAAGKEDRHAHHPPRDRIDKMIAVQRMKQRKKEQRLVTQAQRAASNILARKDAQAARKAKAAAALFRKTLDRDRNTPPPSHAHAHAHAQTQHKRRI